MKRSILTTLQKFQIPKIINRIFNLVYCLFLTACFFVVAYTTFQNGWTNLSKVDKFEGVITERGITTHQTSTSGSYRRTLASQVFYIKLKGLNEILAVYNPKQIYSDLENNLYVGDTIKVFYNKSNQAEKLNLETFQIEKNDQQIINSQDFQGRERIGFYISFIGGFVLLFLTFYQDRKIKRKQEN